MKGASFTWQPRSRVTQIYMVRLAERSAVAGAIAGRGAIARELNRPDAEPLADPDAFFKLPEEHRP